MVTPVGYAYHAQHHVRAELQLMDQPAWVDPAVGIGGGIPALGAVCQQRTAITEARRPCGADVVRLDTNEVHIGPILASQLCAVIVAGVENHDYLDRDRHAKCRGQHRAQTCRKTCSFIMSRNHYDSTVVDTGYWR